MGRRFRVQSGIVGLLVGSACIAVLLRQIDLRQALHALGHVSGPFMVVPLVVFCVNLPLRAWRWQLIFPPTSRPSFWSCLTVLGIGNMANFLLPGRAGDISRCALVGTESSLLEGSRTLGTLAVEKVLDGLALIGMVLFSVWILHPPQWVVELLRVAILVFGVALTLLVVLRYRTRSLIAVVRRIFRSMHLSSLGRFDGLLNSFADGLSAVSSWEQMVLLIAMTTVIWTTEAALIWGLAQSLSLGVTIQSAIVASAILGLGLMIPAAPGGLGTYELFGTKAFQLAGVSASGGLALTVVIHAWVFVANVVAGICLLAVKGISLAQLKNRVELSSASTAQSSS